MRSLSSLFLIKVLQKMHLDHFLSDKTYIQLMFRALVKEKLNLKTPKTFNEKIQWLKLYDRKPEYVKLVDKYEAKRMLSKIIGEEHIVPTYGVWDKFDEIDFDSLPDQFVLKCTHDSGSVVVCNNKATFNYGEAKEKLERGLSKNFFFSSREWPYKYVKPRILAEKYLIDSKTEELRDYKFFCFDGVPKIYKIDFDRFIKHRANYYDLSNKLLPIGEVVCPPDPSKELAPPKKLKQMTDLAENLSKGHAFLRVDFYECNDIVYLGEITFYPNSGFGRFIYKDNDELLGSWIKSVPSKQN